MEICHKLWRHSARSLWEIVPRGHPHSSAEDECALIDCCTPKMVGIVLREYYASFDAFRLASEWASEQSLEAVASANAD